MNNNNNNDNLERNIIKLYIKNLNLSYKNNKAFEDILNIIKIVNNEDLTFTLLLIYEKIQKKVTVIKRLIKIIELGENDVNSADYNIQFNFEYILSVNSKLNNILGIKVLFLDYIKNNQLDKKRKRN